MAVGGLQGVTAEFCHLDGHVEVGLAHDSHFHGMTNQSYSMERLCINFSPKPLMYAIA